MFRLLYPFFDIHIYKSHAHELHFTKKELYYSHFHHHGFEANLYYASYQGHLINKEQLCLLYTQNHGMIKHCTHNSENAGLIDVPNSATLRSSKTEQVLLGTEGIVRKPHPLCDSSSLMYKTIRRIKPSISVELGPPPPPPQQQQTTNPKEEIGPPLPQQPINSREEIGPPPPFVLTLQEADQVKASLQQLPVSSQVDSQISEKTSSQVSTISPSSQEQLASPSQEQPASPSQEQILPLNSNETKNPFEDFKDSLQKKEIKTEISLSRGLTTELTTELTKSIESVGVSFEGSTHKNFRLSVKFRYGDVSTLYFNHVSLALTRIDQCVMMSLSESNEITTIPNKNGRIFADAVLPKECIPSIERFAIIPGIIESKITSLLLKIKTDGSVIISPMANRNNNTFPSNTTLSWLTSEVSYHL